MQVESITECSLILSICTKLPPVLSLRPLFKNCLFLRGSLRQVSLYSNFGCPCRILVAMQGLLWLRICCSQHFSQMEKLEPNVFDFSQGFNQKVVSRSCSVFNSLPASGDFCHLLITFANSLDPDQARLNVGPDLAPNCLTS